MIQIVVLSSHGIELSLIEMRKTGVPRLSALTNRKKRFDLIIGSLIFLYPDSLICIWLSSTMVILGISMILTYNKGLMKFHGKMKLKYKFILVEKIF